MTGKYGAMLLSLIRRRLRSGSLSATVGPSPGFTPTRLDERANPELARIICDFAQERRAAGRPQPHEMWRCVGPFASGVALDLLAAVLNTGTPIERRAAALALSASPDARAAQLLAAAADLCSEISAHRLTWATLQ